MSTPSNLRKPEQDYWLDQPQEERGLSPERQMRQPLGFRSKRQYREESIYGYQDVAKQERDQMEKYAELGEIFAGTPNFEELEVNRGFRISSDEKTMLKRAKAIEKFNKILEEELPEPKINSICSFEDDYDFPQWHWERRTMPSGKTIGVKVYDY